jgi:hypothetical protein
MKRIVEVRYAEDVYSVFGMHCRLLWEDIRGMCSILAPTSAAVTDVVQEDDEEAIETTIHAGSAELAQARAYSKQQFEF